MGNQAKYTPKPWFVNLAASENNTARITCDSGTICLCGPEKHASNEHFHNARLISMAPDMIESLQSMENMFSTYLEEGTLVSNKDIMPIIWEEIENARDIIVRALQGEDNASI
jgi:hypothetical protein